MEVKRTEYEGVSLFSVEDVPAERMGLVFGEGVVELGRLHSPSYSSPASIGEEYEEMIREATEKALKRMCKRAREMGANVVIGVRMAIHGDGSSIHVLVWGTAALL